MLNPTFIWRNRESKPEGATLAECTFDVDSAPMGLNDLTAQIETKPGSSTPTSSLNKAVEEPFLLMWSNPWPVVAHRNPH